MFFRQDVSRREVVQHWADTLDYGLVLPILALEGDRVVGDATLHRQKTGWKQRVGVVRVQIAPITGTRARDRDGPRTPAPRGEVGAPLPHGRGDRGAGAAVRAFEKMGFVRAATYNNFVNDQRGGCTTCWSSSTGCPPRRMTGTSETLYTPPFGRPGTPLRKDDDTDGKRISVPAGKARSARGSPGPLRPEDLPQRFPHRLLRLGGAGRRRDLLLLVRPGGGVPRLGGHTVLALFVAAATVLTVFIISGSYAQIIEAFPPARRVYRRVEAPRGKGGGGLGSALVIDYVLTITISVAAGADAIFSFLPRAWLAYKFHFIVFVLLFLIWINLRGVKESVVALTPIFMAFLFTHVPLILYAVFRHTGGSSRRRRRVSADLSSASREMGWFGSARCSCGPIPWRRHLHADRGGQQLDADAAGAARADGEAGDGVPGLLPRLHGGRIILGTS